MWLKMYLVHNYSFLAPKKLFRFFPAFFFFFFEIVTTISQFSSAKDLNEMDALILGTKVNQNLALILVRNSFFCHLISSDKSKRYF